METLLERRSLDASSHCAAAPKYPSTFALLSSSTTETLQTQTVAALSLAAVQTPPLAYTLSPRNLLGSSSKAKAFLVDHLTGPPSSAARSCTRRPRSLTSPWACAASSLVPLWHCDSLLASPQQTYRRQHWPSKHHTYRFLSINTRRSPLLPLPCSLAAWCRGQAPSAPPLSPLPAHSPRQSCLWAKASMLRAQRSPMSPQTTPTSSTNAQRSSALSWPSESAASASNTRVSLRLLKRLPRLSNPPPQTLLLPVLLVA